MRRYIISIELIDKKLLLHHVLCDEVTYIFTLHTGRIYNPKQNDQVLDDILNGSMGDVVYFYKAKYKIQHSNITLSFGPLLRERIRELKKEGNKNVKM